MKEKDARHFGVLIPLWIIIVLLMCICTRLPAQNTDIQLLRQINTPHELLLDGSFRAVSNSVYITLAAVPLTTAIIEASNHKSIEPTICLITSTALTLGIASLVKYTVNRERPYNRYSDILNKSRTINLGPSFPSGHTASVFNTATFLSLSYPKWYIIVPSFIYATAVAYSRMYLGVHYPSDVIAGAVLGAGTTYLTHYIEKKLLGSKRLCRIN